jgi:hypothetical protein
LTIEYPALFVTGCGRSGTSAVAGLFAESRRFMGDDLHPPRPSNPRGFFESGRINRLNERILLPYLPRPYRYGSIDYGADAPRRTHTWLARIGPDVEVVATAPERAQIREFTANAPFCYKDPRFTYTIHEWVAAVGVPHRVICAFRHPAVVAQSIINEVTGTAYLHDLAISVNQAFEVWALQYGRVVDRHADGNWLFVSFDSLLSGAGLKAVANFTGERLRDDFVTRELDRTRTTLQAPARCLAIYDRMQELAARQ